MSDDLLAPRSSDEVGPNQSGNNGSSKIAVPPPFGSSFNPPTIPTIPENPDPLKHEHYSEAAQHKQRDEHGHFIHSDNSINPPTPPNPFIPSNPTNPSSFLPPIIEVNNSTEPTYKKDPPAFGFFITNPVTYFKAFLNKLIKRQAITVKIPVLAIIVLMVGIGGFGVGFSSGMNWAFARLFPNYSPLLHREITVQGTIQKSSNPDLIGAKGYALQANDKSKTIWTLQSKSANIKLADYVNQNVQVKGNLTPTPNLIDVTEVISFEIKPSPSPTPNTSKILSEVEGPNPSDSSNLPKLYSNLTWEVTQSKTLTFTSGKRRIEQEGVYLESSQVTEIPQDFLDYYTKELLNLGFKQTLNSSEPNGTTITYSKNDLFLTFGIKNIYKGSAPIKFVPIESGSGSGDTKKTLPADRQVVGYKAFIEHN